MFFVAFVLVVVVLFFGSCFCLSACRTSPNNFGLRNQFDFSCLGFGFGGWVFGGARNECVHRGLAVKNAELRGPEPEHCGTRVRGHVVDIYSLGGSHIAEGNAIDTVPP